MLSTHGTLLGMPALCRRDMVNAVGQHLALDSLLVLRLLFGLWPFSCDETPHQPESAYRFWKPCLDKQSHVIRPLPRSFSTVRHDLAVDVPSQMGQATPWVLLCHFRKCLPAGLQKQIAQGKYLIPLVPSSWRKKHALLAAKRCASWRYCLAG